MQIYIVKHADKAPGHKVPPCGSYGELMASGKPAALNNVPAVLGFHALAETMLAFGYYLGRCL
jgi:hypothetical protein